MRRISTNRNVSRSVSRKVYRKAYRTMYRGISPPAKRTEARALKRRSAKR